MDVAAGMTVILGGLMYLMVYTVLGKEVFHFEKERVRDRRWRWFKRH